MRGLVRWVAMLVLVGACAAASAQQTGRRVALVIGNSAYAAQGTLANPGPDSRLVADALRRVGFAVTPVSDAGKPAMERALRDFSRAADGAEVALVYYAGHGLEANGVNWLLPVDAKLEDERDLSFEAISLDTVLATVERARGLRMVVLDACRNNPFARSMRRSASTRATVARGLADVEVTGTLVLYAARGGTVAQDGAPGGNSPFATAFARRIPEPGVDIRLLVSKVRDDVLAATGRVQEPFSYGSLPGVELRLVESALAAPTPRGDLSSGEQSFNQLDRVPQRIRSIVLAARATFEKAKAAELQALTAKKSALEWAARANVNQQGTVIIDNESFSYRGEAIRQEPSFGVIETRGPHPLAGGKYAGSFVNGTNHGYGVFDYRGQAKATDEIEYRGEYLQGRRNGFGSLQVLQGTVYGRFGGMVTGPGIIVFANGQMFEGELSNTGGQGLGVLWSTEGTVVSAGFWVGGVFQESQ